MWIHHKHDVTTITWDEDELGSPNLVCGYLSWKGLLGVYVDHIDPLSRSQRSSFVYMYSSSTDVTVITRQGVELCSPNLVCRYLSWRTCLRLYVDHLDPLPRSQRSSLRINDSSQTWHYHDSSKKSPRITKFLRSYLWRNTYLELYVGHRGQLCEFFINMTLLQ